MSKMFKKFMQDEQGLETVEYAVMAALIVAGIVGTVMALGGVIQDRFGDLQAAIEEGAE